MKKSWISTYLREADLTTAFWDCNWPISPLKKTISGIRHSQKKTTAQWHGLSHWKYVVVYLGSTGGKAALVGSGNLNEFGLLSMGCSRKYHSPSHSFTVATSRI